MNSELPPRKQVPKSRLQKKAAPWVWLADDPRRSTLWADDRRLATSDCSLPARIRRPIRRRLIRRAVHIHYPRLLLVDSHHRVFLFQRPVGLIREGILGNHFQVAGLH